MESAIRMKELKMDLLRTKYTRVLAEADYNFNAPHLYVVIPATDSDATVENALGRIHFQEGPILENGVNGVGNEDLIAMIIDRLEHFQNSEFKCKENAMAITKLEEALLWLRKRTIGREERGVEGTHIV